MRPHELIRLAGMTLWGARWQSALARELGVNVRTIRRWTTGEDIPRASVWRDIHALALHRQVKLAELITKIRNKS